MRLLSLFFKKINFYLNKSILRFSIFYNIFIIILKEQASSIELTLKLLIFIEADRYKILYLMYYYRHLNDINFINFFNTNIIIYRVRIKFDTQFINNNT